MAHAFQRNRLAHARCHRLLAVVLAGLAVGVLPGCDDDQVRTYQAPKSPPYVAPEPMGPAIDSDTAEPGITWDLPDGWQPMSGGSGMALALFEAPGESGAARVSVTPLTGSAGGVLANINRWRGQVGLNSIKTIEDQPMTGLQVDQSPAGLIDLASPQGISAGTERMLVVLVPRPQDDRTWFFKMTGPDDTITRHKQGFVRFVESVQFGGPSRE